MIKLICNMTKEYTKRELFLDTRKKVRTKKKAKSTELEIDTQS